MKLGKISPLRVLRASVACILIFALLYYVDKDLLSRELLSLGFGVFALILFLSLVNIGVIYGRVLALFRMFRIDVHPWLIYRAQVAGLISGLLIFNIAGTIIGRNMELRAAGVSPSAVTILSSVEKATALLFSLIFLAVGGFVLFGGGALNLDRMLDNGILFLSTLALALGTAGTLLAGSFDFRRQWAAVGTRDLRFFGMSLLLSAVSQVVMISVYSGAIHILHPELDILKVASAAAIVSFAASMPISVNGWGVREMTAVFAFGFLGVTAPEALAVSIAVGIGSTIAVLISGAGILIEPPGLAALRQRVKAATRALPDGAGAKAQDGFLRLITILLACLCGVGLFIQLHLDVYGSAVSVNLADATAVLALVLVVSLLLVGVPIHRCVQRAAAYWFIAASVLFATAFLIGVASFGVTPWALNNRLLGWLVLMGYVAIGAMFVGVWGTRAIRRFAEFLACGAAAAVIAGLIGFASHRFFDNPLFVESNFQAFSSNRNTFAFQLLVTAILLLATARARLAGASRWVLLSVVVLILLGVVATGSKAAYLALAAVLAVFLLTAQDWSVHRKFLVPVAGLSILASLILLLSGGDRISDLLLAGEVSQFIATVNLDAYAERWRSIRDGITIWLDSPIFGAGLGYYIQERIATTGQPLVIHSTPVWILSEFGIVGAIILFVAPAVWVMRRLPETTGMRRRQARVLLLLVVTLLVFGLVHEVYYQRIFWVSVGICLGGFLWGCRTVASRTGPAKTVLHVITSLNRGGAERMLLGLLRSRRPDETPIVVSLISGSALVDEARATGVEVHELGFTSARPSLTGFLRLIVLIRRRRPDVVQGWMYHGDLVALLALYLSGRRARTQLVWGIRCSDMDLSKYSRALRAVVWICARMSPLTDAVTANSQTGLEVHRRIGYRSRRFHLVPNGTDVEKFCPDTEHKRAIRTELGLPPDCRVVAHVARVDPMKDHALLLRVAAALPGLHFVLVGKGTESLDLPANVTALGQRGDVEWVLKAADGIVSSSAYGEGFSNAVVEGMAAGLVPIGTDVGETRRVAGGVGWIVPPGDFDALRGALAQFERLDGPALSRAQAAARDHVVDRYTLDAAADSFRAVYAGTAAPYRPIPPADPVPAA